MTQARTTTLDNHVDAFVAARLPTWLRQASVGQINKLRDCFATHRATEQALNSALSPLPTPQQFAQAAYAPLLETLSAQLDLAGFEWLEIRRRFTVAPGGGLPTDEILPLRTPALLRLMQNFPAGATFYEGTGLVRSGSDTVLSGEPSEFVTRCRALDIGKRYQELLKQQASPQVRRLLIESKRSAFALALQLAVLQGRLSASQHAALRAMSEAGQVKGLAGQLTMLHCVIADGLLIQLRGDDGQNLGVVLYLPRSAQTPLRHFADEAQMVAALKTDLDSAAKRERFAEQVRLSDRETFLSTLNKRLLDERTDLALEGATLHKDVFEHLAEAHVERIEDDARMLLVSNADADASEAKARMARWAGIAMDAAGVAGLFVPGIGELLLADLVVDVTQQTYAGVADWARGHRHEAVEHLLGVAEVVAVTAVGVGTVGLVARGFAHSDFIDGLEPVDNDGAQARLWHRDLQPYAVSPLRPMLQEDGLFTDGERRFLRIDGRFHEVYQPDPQAAWRLRHPSGDEGYEPEVHNNGERCWRVRLERPLDWDDRAYMLDRLWPSDPPLSPTRAGQVLQAAGMDEEELRGILVENRPVPFNLRDALRRFQADARITRLLEGLRQSPPSFDDPAILQWCRARPGMQTLDEAQVASQLLADPASWRGELFAHLSDVPLPDDPLLAVINRDFPGLPAAYTVQATQGLSPSLRQVALAEKKLPLELAQKARSLLALARVNRAVEGLFLEDCYTSGTGELALALLRRWASWPDRLNLELREGSASGRLLSVLDPQGAAEARTVLVERQGRFRLYDHRGLEREEEIDSPGGLFEALLAMLTADQRQALGMAGDDASRQLRARLIDLLPARHSGVLNLLGWREGAPWFNPGVRLSDGRVGYPLGGRATRQRGARGTLRDRVRALYPGFDNAQVMVFIQRLLREGDVFENLLRQERNYARLDSALSRWQAAIRDGAVRAQRTQLADLLRAAWRLEGEVMLGSDGATGGLRLNLSGWRVTQLPALPEEVDLSHVEELVMAGLDLEQVPANFLHCFHGLRTLTLTNNRLTNIPAGVTQLGELRHLSLMANRIRMTPSNREVLASLSRLHSLNLSHNPLRTLDLRLEMPSQLRSLRLAFCGLTRTPYGLEQCEHLDFVDLSDNQISDLPTSLMSQPWAFRARINLARNALSARTREDFYSVDRHGVTVRPAQPMQDTMESWLRGEPTTAAQARSQLWDRLHGQEGSTGLFELLQALREGSDFLRAAPYVRDQVWSLLETLDGDQVLRQQIFASAAGPRGCVDSVAERFSRLQIEVLVFQAGQRSTQAEAGSELLDLGKRLFRLERVDAYALRVVKDREQAGQQVDELEVVLGYRIRLADALNLPCQPRSMVFTRLADITAQDERDALEVVRAEATREALVHSVSKQSFWLAYLRAQHTQVFAGVEDAFGERGTKLDERAERDASRAEQIERAFPTAEPAERKALLAEQEALMNSERYTQAWEDLRAERDAGEHELALQLTREALEEAEGGQTAHRD
ncbi:NEL-type E3 ubiquitin ligase domain-containing protein [Pseudomonas sp. S31]|uniref:NEL-type E3 ubiquitin ligase domain-containing protein n=1 Tax=Pseudomonas sp. S31 TaxID=1564473 RepID=UPI00191451A3|nr:NEL-type E3 ubiquitin ligase domain-containing protein [Pseudomonas sp. S31]